MVGRLALFSARPVAANERDGTNLSFNAPRVCALAHPMHHRLVANRGRSVCVSAPKSRTVGAYTEDAGFFGHLRSGEL